VRGNQQELCARLFTSERSLVVASIGALQIKHLVLVARSAQSEEFRCGQDRMPHLAETDPGYGGCLVMKRGEDGFGARCGLVPVVLRIGRLVGAAHHGCGCGSTHGHHRLCTGLKPTAVPDCLVHCVALHPRLLNSCNLRGSQRVRPDFREATAGAQKTAGVMREAGGMTPWAAARTRRTFATAATCSWWLSRSRTACASNCAGWPG
jgi:hypothetical protein